MKKIILLFLLIPIHLFSQNHFTLGGTYRFGNDINKEDIGEILIVPTSDSSALLYITTSKKAPSFNTSVLLTEIDVVDNKAYYQPKTGSGRLDFEFFKNGIKVTDLNEIISTHVFLKNKEFIKVDTSIPQTFFRGNGKDVEIDKTAAEYHINYYPNNTLWDFIGVWQYGQFSEALNISKDLRTNSIVIQYNSRNDGFEDRFIENCQFSKGKIHGDYYGGKENVILEIEEGNLLLTIDPFHQFQPIKKQLFKTYPTSVFKYCAKEENIYIKDGNKNIDSLPPGDRVLVQYKPESKDYFSPLFYTSKFIKSPSDQKKKGYIVSDKLSDIKPLFISQNTKLKFFQRLNVSEQFVKQLYTPEKLKDNISIETVPEQNIIGQKKLLVDQDAYDKLALKNIKDHYEEIFITGTVDLAKEFRTIVVDFQSDNEYSTYLVNYNSNGAYIDHILIGYNDYVESFTPIKAVFPSGEIIVNYMIFTSNDNETSSENIFESKRYIINSKGQFLISNYDVSFMQKPETELEVTSQTFNTKTVGNMVLSLYLNIIDTNNAGGYVTSMFIKMEADSLMDQTIPMDLSGLCGFHFPPYGDFIGPTGELQKLFSANIYDGVQEGLSITISLEDGTDGTEELSMKIIDNNYSNPPKETYHFIKEGGSWVIQY